MNQGINFEMSLEVRASAPGRVNLIGEHTDYNHGFVLPTSIPQTTHVTLKKRNDRSVEAISCQASDENRISYLLGEESPSSSWGTYLQGITKILSTTGYSLSGFEAKITSTVPIGSGLSSSAALEVSIIRGLRELFSLSLSDVEIARICQRVENEFVGARVGIMDPMACSLAGTGQALFLDTQNLSYRQVQLPEAMELIVINSGVAHRNVGGGYNERRNQCEEACSRLGIQSLRELTITDLPRLQILPSILVRRARHVITENDRVIQTVTALESGDLEKIGRLFQQSHLSMRDDYEVSIPEIDLLVELACSTPHVYGARLTGGGFGGSIVALAQKEKGLEAARQIARRYEESSYCKPTVLVPLESV